MAARFDLTRAAEQGQSVGTGTPVHVTIPTDKPWVPLRILGLGKPADEFGSRRRVPDDRDQPNPARRAGPAGVRPRPPGAGVGVAAVRPALRRRDGVDARVDVADQGGRREAGDLKYDLAIDASGAGKPSPEAAGLLGTDPGETDGGGLLGTTEGDNNGTGRTIALVGIGASSCWVSPAASPSPTGGPDAGPPHPAAHRPPGRARAGRIVSGAGRVRRTRVGPHRRAHRSLLEVLPGPARSGAGDDGQDRGPQPRPHRPRADHRRRRGRTSATRREPSRTTPPVRARSRCRRGRPGPPRSRSAPRRARWWSSGATYRATGPTACGGRSRSPDCRSARRPGGGARPTRPTRR